MKRHYLQLLTYNEWSNQRYLDLFFTMKDIPERMQVLFSHVLVAQKLWLTRIKGNPDLTLHIWEKCTLEELQVYNTQNTIDWKEYVENHSDEEWDRLVSYENFQKISYNNTAGDIFMQCINHATYHRAQFAILLRQMGIDPPNTDFITFSRYCTGQPY